MNVDYPQTTFDLQLELKRVRARIYKLAAVIGLLAAGPVIALKDVAPWFVVIPIAAGGIIAVALDIQESRRTAEMLRLVRHISILQYSAQSLARVSRKPLASTSPPLPASELVDLEKFEAQAREGNTHRQLAMVDA